MTVQHVSTIIARVAMTPVEGMCVEMLTLTVNSTMVVVTRML